MTSGCLGKTTLLLVSNLMVRRNHFGGYYFSDEYIRCFSHSHMVGSGVLDLGNSEASGVCLFVDLTFGLSIGNLGVMPTTTTPSTSLVTDYGYRSYYSHDTESESRTHALN